MERVWLIRNRKSGSVSDAGLRNVEDYCDEGTRTLVGSTDFPEQPLPGETKLRDREIDLLVVFAGDGTVNAVASAIGDWDGDILVLPGGTMNILAERLHGGAGLEDILARAAKTADASSPSLQSAGSNRGEPLPYVNISGRQAYVAALVGPAAGWVHVRETLRGRRWKALRRSVSFAWKLTFSRSVRASIGARPQLRGRLVQVEPPAEPDGEMAVAVFRFDGLFGAIRMATAWLLDTLHVSQRIERLCARNVRVTGRGVVHALIDGEEQHLRSPVRVEQGISSCRFRRVSEHENIAA
ncbi:diacylglycerol/lipid kinase family protein [Pacificimonas flava]|nr:diacylglycerol kinase family protein [Pacificimonas flava]